MIVFDTSAITLTDDPERDAIIQLEGSAGLEDREQSGEECLKNNKHRLEGIMKL